MCLNMSMPTLSSQIPLPNVSHLVCFNNINCESCATLQAYFMVLANGGQSNKQWHCHFNFFTDKSSMIETCCWINNPHKGVTSIALEPTGMMPWGIEAYQFSSSFFHCTFRQLHLTDYPAIKQERVAWRQSTVTLKRFLQILVFCFWKIQPRQESQDISHAHCQLALQSISSFKQNCTQKKWDKCHYES